MNNSLQSFTGNSRAAPHILKTCLFFILFFFQVFAWIPCSFSQDTTDADIKAALVFKFPVYVTWPEKVMNDKIEFFECCILGNDPVSDILIHFNGEKVLQKTIRVTRLTDIQSIESCHMLFIGSSYPKNLFEIFESIKDKHILTVSDMEDFAQKGGIINFVTKDDSVHFKINKDAGNKAGLEISSKLLRLAEIVNK